MFIVDGNEVEEFNILADKFYALIGRCILAYQQVEDFLPHLFCSLTTIEPKKAEELFRHIRGIEDKIKIIKSAMDSEEHRQTWSGLSRAVKLRSDKRNEMAHGSVLNHGGMVTIQAGATQSEPASIFRTTKPNVFLYKSKRAKTGFYPNPDDIWTLDQLQEEHRITKNVMRELMAFRHALAACEQPIPDAPDHAAEDD